MCRAALTRRVGLELALVAVVVITMSFSMMGCGGSGAVGFGCWSRALDAADADGEGGDPGEDRHDAEGEGGHPQRAAGAGHRDEAAEEGHPGGGGPDRPAAVVLA